jgi:hypothetical protein
MIFVLCENWYQGLSEKLVPRLTRNTGTKALQKTDTKAYLKN